MNFDKISLKMDKNKLIKLVSMTESFLMDYFQMKRGICECDNLDLCK